MDLWIMQERTNYWICRRFLILRIAIGRCNESGLTILGLNRIELKEMNQNRYSDFSVHLMDHLLVL